MSGDRQSDVFEALRRNLITPDKAKELLTQFAPPKHEGLPAELPKFSPWQALGDFFSKSTESAGLDTAAKSLLPTEEGARAGGRIVRGVGSAALGATADIGQSLMPTETGARAGGRVLGKVGDVGTFLSGGLAGPIGPPPTLAKGVGDIARGVDVQPRVAQVPKPQLALPPPTMQAAGRPAMPAGQGMMPPGPGATMTAPSASPVLSAGRPAAPPEPPRTLIKPNAELGDPSTIAKALLSNDGATIDRSLMRKYRQTFRPKEDIGSMDQRITSAVDSLIADRDNITYKAENGRDMPAGSTPRTIQQFMQGIDQLKTKIFQQYNNLAQGAEVQIPLAPLANRARQIAMSDELVGVASKKPVHDLMMRQADTFDQMGSLTPIRLQNMIKSLNEDLQSTIRGGDSSIHNAATAMNDLLIDMREYLNQNMEKVLQGPQYQALRTRYGALGAIEGDVATALRKQMEKVDPTVLDRVTRPASWIGMLYSLATHDPTGAVVAIGVDSAKAINRYLKSPNVAVTKMFNNRMRELTPSYTDRLSSQAATKLGDLRQQRYDAIRSGNLQQANDLAEPFSQAQSNYNRLSQ